MESVLERAARALCALDRLDPDADWRITDGVILEVALEPGKEQRWRTYVRKARAVLAAVKEPSEDMIEAGFRAPQRGMNMGESAEATWTAMIDAALEDPR